VIEQQRVRPTPADPKPGKTTDACSPQAWGTGASLLVRTLLGLDARGGQLILDSHVPEEIGRICVSGAHAFGDRWDSEAIGSKDDVRLANR
jgi:hypothetical protein